MDLTGTQLAVARLTGLTPALVLGRLATWPLRIFVHTRMPKNLHFRKFRSESGFYVHHDALLPDKYRTQRMEIFRGGIERLGRWRRVDWRVPVPASVRVDDDGGPCMWKVRNFEPRWAMACNRLARAAASAAGCSLDMNRNIYSFSLSDQGVVARLVPRSYVRDKLLVAFRADAPGADEAAEELAAATGEDLGEHLDGNFGRDVQFYFVPTEPEDAEHVAAIKRTLVSFLVEPQPRVDFNPPSLPGVIEQLSDARSLKAEGNKMETCVGRYAFRASQRKSFVFRVLQGIAPDVDRSTLRAGSVKASAPVADDAVEGHSQPTSHAGDAAVGEGVVELR